MSLQDFVLLFKPSDLILQKSVGVLHLDHRDVLIRTEHLPFPSSWRFLVTAIQRS